MFLGGRGGGAATQEGGDEAQLKHPKSSSSRLNGGSSPPVGKLRLKCDSERGLASPQTSAQTTAIDRETTEVTCVTPPLTGDCSCPSFQQQTVISGVSGLGRQAEEGRNVLQHVAEKHRLRFNPGLKSPADIWSSCRPGRVRNRARGWGGAPGPSHLLTYEEQTPKTTPAVTTQL